MTRLSIGAGVSAAVLIWGAGGAWGMSDGFTPPEGYYAPAVYDGTPDSLRQSLNSIIRGHTIRSYASARQSLAILDADPANPSNVILTYNGASVSGTWDSGVTWNREHTWPRSRGVGDNGPDFSDLHALRPCNPGINSSRGNKPFGLASAEYWDPTMAVSPIDFRGEMARAMFYMDIRYDGSESNTVDLRVVNGFPGTNQMGDLFYMLDWHYEEQPSWAERRRNHLIYSFDDNPFYAQGNRNPFIDRPEFVWALWGTEPNNSQISIAGAGVQPDGSSEQTVDLGRFVMADSLEDAFVHTVEIQKTGHTPTSYLVEAFGDAYSSVHGIPGTVGRDNRQAEVEVALWSSAPGPLLGEVTIRNTDLTSAGMGLGSADADDVVTLLGEGVWSSAASFEPTPNQTTLTLDLGTLSRSLDTQMVSAPIFNAGGNSEQTAGLLLTGIDAFGDVAFFTVSDLPDQPIAGGGFVVVDVITDLSGPTGVYEVMYAISNADESIPGAMEGMPLMLTVTVEIELSDCPADLTGDGAVNLADLNLVLANFGTASGATLGTGDANGDGAVDLADLNIVLASFGSTCP